MEPQKKLKRAWSGVTGESSPEGVENVDKYKGIQVLSQSRDLEIVVGQDVNDIDTPPRSFWIHSCVAWRYCPSFRTLLSKRGDQAFEESQEPIHLPNTHPIAFQNIVNYMYQGIPPYPTTPPNMLLATYQTAFDLGLTKLCDEIAGLFLEIEPIRDFIQVGNFIEAICGVHRTGLARHVKNEWNMDLYTKLRRLNDSHREIKAEIRERYIRKQKDIAEGLAEETESTVPAWSDRNEDWHEAHKGVEWVPHNEAWVNPSEEEGIAATKTAIQDYEKEHSRDGEEEPAVCGSRRRSRQNKLHRNLPSPTHSKAPADEYHMSRHTWDRRLREMFHSGPSPPKEDLFFSTWNDPIVPVEQEAADIKIWTAVAFELAKEESEEIQLAKAVAVEKRIRRKHAEEDAAWEEKIRKREAEREAGAAQQKEGIDEHDTANKHLSAIAGRKRRTVQEEGISRTRKKRKMARSSEVIAQVMSMELNPQNGAIQAPSQRDNESDRKARAELEGSVRIVVHSEVVMPQMSRAPAPRPKRDYSHSCTSYHHHRSERIRQDSRYREDKRTETRRYDCHRREQQARVQRERSERQQKHEDRRREQERQRRREHEYAQRRVHEENVRRESERRRRIDEEEQRKLQHERRMRHQHQRQQSKIKREQRYQERASAINTRRMEEWAPTTRRKTRHDARN